MALWVKAAVRTDMGRVRANNEDNFYLDGTFLEKEEMDAGGAFAVDASSACALFAVCDGMGGEAKGEEASLTAVRALDGLRDALAQGGVGDVRALIDAHCKLANDAVFALDGGCAGTTFVGLLLYEDEAYCMNLGDSRLYVLRDGKLRRISEDHNEAATLVQGGVMSRAEAEKSVYSHVVTRYVGMPPLDEPFGVAHYTDFVLHYGDRFLLCSDGLTDMLPEGEIEEILRCGRPVNETVGLLVDSALARGGRDNVTALVAEIEPETPESEPPQPEPDGAQAQQAEPNQPPRRLFDDDSTTLALEGWTEADGAAQAAADDPAQGEPAVQVAQFGAQTEPGAARDAERYLEDELEQPPFTLVERMAQPQEGGLLEQALEPAQPPLAVRDSRPAEAHRRGRGKKKRPAGQAAESKDGGE